MSRLTIVVAATTNNGIGRGSQMPWRLPKDSRFFARATSVTKDGCSSRVVMGRTTWESIPKKFRPLPNRVNVVVTRNKAYEILPDSTTPIHLKFDLEASLSHLTTCAPAIHRTYIVGGASVYEQALALPVDSSIGYVDRILLTRILSPVFDDCDTFMPDFIKQGEKEGNAAWRKATHAELEAWVGFEVAEGVQEDNGATYEFQMWVR